MDLLETKSEFSLSIVITDKIIEKIKYEIGISKKYRNHFNNFLSDFIYNLFQSRLCFYVVEK